NFFGSEAVDFFVTHWASGVSIPRILCRTASLISSSLLTPRHLLVVVLLLAEFAGHALFVSFWAGFYGNKKADHDDVGQHSKRSKRGETKHRGFLFFSRSVVLIPAGQRH